MQVHQAFLPAAACPNLPQERTRTCQKRVSFSEQVPVWIFRETRVPVCTRVLMKADVSAELTAAVWQGSSREVRVSVVWRFCGKEEYSPHSSFTPSAYAKSVFSLLHEYVDLCTEWSCQPPLTWLVKIFYVLEHKPALQLVEKIKSSHVFWSRTPAFTKTHSLSTYIRDGW